MPVRATKTAQRRPRTSPQGPTPPPGWDAGGQQTSGARGWTPRMRSAGLSTSPPERTGGGGGSLSTSDVGSQRWGGPQHHQGKSSEPPHQTNNPILTIDAPRITMPCGTSRPCTTAQVRGTVGGGGVGRGEVACGVVPAHFRRGSIQWRTPAPPREATMRIAVVRRRRGGLTADGWFASLFGPAVCPTGEDGDGGRKRRS
jgi:hypothetical protein